MKKNHNKKLIILIATVFSLSVQLFAQATVNQKPNIIFVLTDDLGYGDLGVFFQNQRRLANDKSKPTELTPQLDKMAQSGAIFSSQYANAPVCAPSRASFLTGLKQGNAMVRNNQFDKALEENHNVATLLKSAGYQTVAIGKWGLQGEKEEGPNWPAHPLKRGFDYFFGYMRHADGHEHYPVEGLYRGKKQVWENYQNVAADLAKCYTTDLWTAKAKQWIIQHQTEAKQQPFFMFLAYDAPHAVLELPTQAYPTGGGLNGGLQWLNKPGNMINTASGEVDTYINPEYAEATYDNDQSPATPEIAWPNTYKRYATATKRIDDGIGDLFTLLKDLKIDENTLVVFTSDNGASIESYLPAPNVPNHPDFFGSNGPFDGIKRDCWEGGLRVPTIARWPGVIKPQTQIDQASMLSDWMPTFAEVAKIPAPARVDGVSLLPSLTGKGKQQKSNVYVEYFEGGRTPNFDIFDVNKRNRQRGQMQMLRINDFAGVRYHIQSADDDFEIYNVVTDPKQSHNLAKLPEYKALQKEFKAKALQARRVDSQAKRPYDNAPIAAETVSSTLIQGAAVSFYPTDVNYVINAKSASIKPSVKPVKRGRVVPQAGTKVFSGYWEMEAGQYEIRFQSTQAVLVRFHEAILVDTDFSNQKSHHLMNGPTQLIETISVSKGLHPISVAVKLNKGEKEMVKMEWRKVGETDWQAFDNNIYQAR